MLSQTQRSKDEQSDDLGFDKDLSIEEKKSDVKEE